MEIAISRWLLFSFFALLTQAQDETAFLSLDCGLPANSSGYNDPKTNIRYISDAGYINAGESRSVAPDFKKYEQPQWNLRSFPQEIRNCYNISAIKSTSYLIRATFLYGNYDGLNNTPRFDLYLGDTQWTTVDEDDSYYTEMIHIPSTDNLQICLINIDQGTPFISTLEFRKLPSLSYFTVYSLYLYKRYDMGSITNKEYRFPDDVYDRVWEAYQDNNYAQLSTLDSVAADNLDETPAVVMKTAATAKKGTKYLDFSWDSRNVGDKYFVYMHFAELEKLQSNQFRGFNITHNGDYWDGPIIPEYLSTTTAYDIFSSIKPASRHQFSLFPIQNSTLPPIINALEIYVQMEISDLESYNGDVDAISNIRSTYGVKKNWEGDPCVPSGYPWSGLSCNSDSVPRITSLNLSSNGLKGEISLYIFSLPMLQTLDLSNNYLTGEVPKFLSQLLHLKNLNLENNNLSGSLPPDLIKKKMNGSLTLSVEGNPNLCTSEPCTKMTPEQKKSNNNFIIPVVAAVGGLLAFLIIAAIIYWIAKSNKKQQGKDVALTVNPGSSLEKRRQQFTYAQVVMMTNNFERILGKGGFGMVYYGVLDDTQVAVKMISPSAIQGYSQFQAEVTILMRVHHRNLTNLVGYMNDGGHLGLIYEYMAKGNLAEHLSDKSSSILSWEDRLQIAIEAAQGLEYLHHGCKPPIVHRDVKTTNILLTENFNAKLSDFGLSKTYPTDDKSYMSTVIVGTPGYLDPEYYTSNRLTEKSDVYGFGVSLMEIISCRPVISNTPDRETNYIAKWVRTMVDQGDIKNIVDPRLNGAYKNNSVWKAVEVALACVSVDSYQRPTMNQVVIELKDCLAMELNQRSESRPLESKDSIEMMSISMVMNATHSSPMPR
ncbi:LRR receptor-like serine/threonine-protein kinase IOS1 [Benincasa hispida]|uniref:LRR receptor-like serine/threonine-protein kinase IOS1 n=1 Tax=Benincasa hispida TaxID=102211 RepID=UPI0019016A2F|nr:LRR receptor-like serine/threonine-protein kinase IOS1 [Benincasa hispida]